MHVLCTVRRIKWRTGKTNERNDDEEERKPYMKKKKTIPHLVTTRAQNQKRGQNSLRLQMFVVQICTRTLTKCWLITWAHTSPIWILSVKIHNNNNNFTLNSLRYVFINRIKRIFTCIENKNDRYINHVFSFWMFNLVFDMMFVCLMCNNGSCLVIMDGLVHRNSAYKIAH